MALFANRFVEEETFEKIEAVVAFVATKFATEVLPRVVVPLEKMLRAFK